MNPTSAETMFVYIGSYAKPSTPGIYACTYNTETGQLTPIDQISGVEDPTFLTIDRDNRKLYAIGTVWNEQEQKNAEIQSYAIAEDGKLTFMNRQPTVAPTCHITQDRTKRCLIVSSYHGGMIGLSPLLDDGSVGPIADVHQHEGSSVHPNQKSPHPHSVFLDQNNRYAICCDLGIDQIVIYKLDTDHHRLIPHGRTKLQAGAGPRHFAFHPTLPYGYVINELNSTVTAFHYDAEAGSLTEIETVSTLPEDYAGESYCADIHISNDGRYVYGSNRGHDSIVVYEIDPTNGTLSAVQHISTGGGHPRNFALSPDNRFLLAANRDSNNIVAFARDAETGKLQATGFELQVSKPVCVKFMVL